MNLFNVEDNIRITRRTYQHMNKILFIEKACCTERRTCRSNN